MTVNNFFGHLDQKRCQKRDFCSGGAYGMLNVNCMHLSPPNSNRDNNAVSVLLIWLLLLMKLQWYFGQTFNIHFQHSEFALWHIVIYSKCVSIKKNRYEIVISCSYTHTFSTLNNLQFLFPENWKVETEWFSWFLCWQLWRMQAQEVDPAIIHSVLSIIFRSESFSKQTKVWE